MTDATNEFDAALAAWRRGDAGAAIRGLEAASRGGDQAALGAMLDIALTFPPGASERQAASDALNRAQGRSALRLRAAALALGWFKEADPLKAVEQRLADAAAGDAAALNECGLLALMAGDAPRAEAYLLAAADAGSGHAFAALLRLGAETGRLVRPFEDLAGPLAATGHPLAHALGHAARALPVHAEAAAAPEDLSLHALAARLCTAFKATPSVTTLCAAPHVRSAEAVIPAPVCDYVAAGAAPLLQPSTVHAGAGRDVAGHGHRTGLSAAVGPSASDLVVAALKARMAALAGLTAAQGEWLSVIAYRPGEQYRPHFDFLTAGGASADSDLAARGQRVRTCLVLLNTEFTGGETLFPHLDVTWRGARGDALVFDNTGPQGAGDPQTLHAGAPVTDGMKILASLWLRQTPW